MELVVNGQITWQCALFRILPPLASHLLTLWKFCFELWSNKHTNSKLTGQFGDLMFPINNILYCISLDTSLTPNHSRSVPIGKIHVFKQEVGPLHCWLHRCLWNILPGNNVCSFSLARHNNNSSLYYMNDCQYVPKRFGLLLQNVPKRFGCLFNYSTSHTISPSQGNKIHTSNSLHKIHTATAAAHQPILRPKHDGWTSYCCHNVITLLASEIYISKIKNNSKVTTCSFPQVFK